MNKGYLFNLSKRKIPGDLIDMSKMLIWFRDINAENYITVERLHRTRRNYHFKISRKIFSCYKAFFNLQSSRQCLKLCIP